MILPEQQREGIANWPVDRKARLTALRAMLRKGEDEMVERERRMRRRLKDGSVGGDAGVSHFAQSSKTAESATDVEKGIVRWMGRELLFSDEDGSRQDGEESDENKCTHSKYIRMFGHSG